MARPKKTPAPAAMPGLSPASESMLAQQTSNGKVQVALQITPRARNYLNTVASLSGQSQAEVVEELLMQDMKSGRLQQMIAQL